MKLENGAQYGLLQSNLRRARHARSGRCGVAFGRGRCYFVLVSLGEAESADSVVSLKVDSQCAFRTSEKNNNIEIKQ